jgi:integrase
MMARGLTVLKVENAKAAPNKRREIADAGKPGLYLVIQPSGAKSWAVRYRRLSDKAPRKFTLDGFPSLGLARRLAQDVLDKVAEGHDPATQKQIERQAKRDSMHERDEFAAVARQFIERDQRPENRTWTETARLLGLRPSKDDPKELVTIRDGLVDRWGKRKIQEITKRDIADLLDGIVDRGAGIMANRSLAAVRRLFNWCIGRGIVSVSPCAGIEAPVAEKSRDRLLSDDEVRMFWRACDALPYPFGPAAKLLLLTGARRSEVGDMMRDEVDLDSGIWTIPAERAKNGQTHAVPLPDSALAILTSVPEIKSERGYVFTTTGETPVSGWSKAKAQIDELMLKEARKGDAKAKIAPWRVHDLRRVVASGMAREGISLPVIEKCLNHISGSFSGIVKVYQHHDFANEKAAAFAVWARRVEQIVSGKPAAVVQPHRDA